MASVLKRLLVVPAALGIWMGYGRTWADTASLTIDVDHPGVRISPMLYGIFFEDINRSGDGGLYAEMLQNRSFEDFDVPMGWSLLDEGDGQMTMTLDKSQPLNEKNLTSLRLDISRLGSGGRAGVVNQGYKGILIDAKDPVGMPPPEWIKRFNEAQGKPENGLNLAEGKAYRCSVEARADATFSGPLTVSLEKQDGTVLAGQDIMPLGAAWKKYELTLIPTGSDANARFVISAKTTGTVWLDMVSLFPDDTFNHRPNGLRTDLMQMLVDLHPAFVRFPGGSYGEGHRLDDAFRWKETLGDLAGRPGQWNIWGYRSSDGLGYFEYLQMCEDLKAEPLFVINCGMAESAMVDVKDLGPWVQDAVDCIDYANGPVASPRGAQRAAAGHPAPFNLKYLEIGNENGMGYFWGGGNADQYAQRYTPFYNAIKAAYPQIHTIATAPIQKPPLKAPVDMVDEHYYPTAEWFEDHATLYDQYDRAGPKIYVGEYATKPGAGDGNLNAALGEAAFMTGMERNSDVVLMSSYAPLFVNPAWRAWSPNLIVFDNRRAYGTPSYYNQLLFSNNRPDVVLPLDLQLPSDGERNARKSLYAVAGRKDDTGEIILKVVNIGDRSQAGTIQLTGHNPILSGRATVLTSARPDDENSVAEPTRIVPKDTDLGPISLPLSYTFAPYSITVLHLKTK